MDLSYADIDLTNSQALSLDWLSKTSRQIVIFIYWMHKLDELIHILIFHTRLRFAIPILIGLNDSDNMNQSKRIIEFL